MGLDAAIISSEVTPDRILFFDEIQLPFAPAPPDPFCMVVTHASQTRNPSPHEQPVGPIAALLMQGCEEYRLGAGGGG